VDTVIDNAEVEGAVVEAFVTVPADGDQEVAIAIGVDDGFVANVGVGGGIDGKFG
jgi:hypothetical protein